MQLWAISDLHLANRKNREALAEIRSHPDDGLIVAGDVGETVEQLEFALDLLCRRFRQLFWVPGNHDLWVHRDDPQHLRGVGKYRRLVEICRSYGVRTPEDPYLPWGDDYLVAPLFCLYDYSFRPSGIPLEEAVEWAAESGVMCSDEVLLDPTPHPSREAWCQERLRVTEPRLEAAARTGRQLILISHFPLRRDLVQLKRIPRFSIWCGTTATEDWHTRFRAAAVIYGHLHINATHIRDGVRFDEVSLGYPRDWDPALGINTYVRRILPEPDSWLLRR